MGVECMQVWKAWRGRGGRGQGMAGQLLEGGRRECCVCHRVFSSQSLFTLRLLDREHIYSSIFTLDSSLGVLY